MVTLKEAMLLINVCFSAREWKEEEKEEEEEEEEEEDKKMGESKGTCQKEKKER